MRFNSIAQSSMKSLKKLTLGGLTLAALAMAAPHPAKADTVTTAIDAVNVILTIGSDYGIKWTYTQQKRVDTPPPPPPPPPPQK
jgi:hypothetical protein